MKRLFPAILILAASTFAQEPDVASPDVPPPDAPSTVEAPPTPEYSGPAILSRRQTPVAGRPGEVVNLRPFLGINAIYDNGLLPVSVNPNGQIPVVSAFGGELNGGVLGSHLWRRTRLDLDYRGNLNHYSKKTYYDGFDNSLLLSVSHQLSKRLSFNVGESFASYARAGFFNGLGGSFGTTSPYPDPTYGALTANDIFDGRTTALTSSGQLVFQKSLRTSFGAGVSGFFVRRRSSALAGVNGYFATGDWAYRLTKFQTIGVQYSFNHFDFTHTFGSSDMHGIALTYAVQLGRHWQFSALAGGYRVENLLLQQIKIDPAVAAIIGQSYGVGTLHSIVWVPNVQGSLNRTFRHAQLNFEYQRMVLPGNGVYLTSGSESETAGYSYAGIRRLNIGLSGGATKFTSLGRTLGTFRNYYGGGGFTYMLRRSFSLVGRIDARRFRIESQTPFQKLSYRATLGFTWSPGDIPLALW